MIWLLATRGASHKPYAGGSETVIDGVHSVVYKPGITPIVMTAGEENGGPLGTFLQGPHRLSGMIFSFSGTVAETLYAIDYPIDLIIRYRASGQQRIRTLRNLLFLGDSTVTIPTLNEGIPELIGVSFRMQLPIGTKVSTNVIDEEEEE